MARGIPIVLSAPSGTGKTTLCNNLLASDPALAVSVSFTTRPPRGNERDGVHYHFVDDARFDALVAAGDLAEWAAVHGHRYGSGATLTQGLMEAGRDVLFDIDVQGGELLKARWPGTVLILLVPPSMEVLAHRLRGRGTDSAASVERRLRVARAEVARGLGSYGYVVVNDDLSRAQLDLEAVIRAERIRQADRGSLVARLGLET
jgi:guanylate kinase